MTTTADKIKLLLAVLLLLAGVAGFHYLAEQALVVRILAVLVSVAAAAGVALTSVPGKAALGFAREAVAEAQKVVWPSRKETLQTTGAVFALVLMMSIFLWVVDASLAWAVKNLMGWGG